MSHSFASRPAAIVTMALLALGAEALGHQALAQRLEKWTLNGVPMVSSYNDRAYPVSVADGAGGAFVAWQERGILRMQRLTADGTVFPGWDPTMGLKVCDEPNRGGYIQSSPRAVSDGAGGVYVMWNDQRNYRCSGGCIGDPKQIFLQRITPEGRIAPGWPALGVDVGAALAKMVPQPHGLRGYPQEMNPVLREDGAGGALIAWTEPALSYYPTTSIPGVHVQSINASGQRLWGERGLRVSGPGDATAAYPDIAPDGQGGAIVAWQDSREAGGFSRVFVQQVSPEGQPQLKDGGEPFSERPLADERYPQILSLGGDATLIVWEAATGLEAWSIFARAFDGRGLGRNLRATLLSETALPDGDPALLPEGEIAWAADSKKGAWIAWIDVSGEAGRSIRVQHVRDDGRPVGGWPAGGVEASAGFGEHRARPMVVDDGVSGVYVGWRDEAEPRVIRLIHDGTIARGWPEGGLPLTQPEAGDRGFHMIADAAAGAIAVWDQLVTFTGLDDVRGQRVGPGSSSLKGFARRTSGESLEPAAGAARLGLIGLQPNPAESEITIAFSLPGSQSATLEVFDLLGRRVLQREVGSLGVGEHRLTLEPSQRLRPGIYQIRLTQGVRQLTTRGIVTR